MLLLLVLLLLLLLLLLWLLLLLLLLLPLRLMLLLLLLLMLLLLPASIVVSPVPASFAASSSPVMLNTPVAPARPVGSNEGVSGASPLLLLSRHLHLAMSAEHHIFEDFCKSTLKS